MWSLYALILGFFLDLIVGDPHGIPHPVVYIGKLIDLTETGMRKLFPKTVRGENVAGAAIWLIVVIVSTGLPALTVTTISQMAAPATFSPRTVFGKTFRMAFSVRSMSLPIKTMGWGIQWGSPTIKSRQKPKIRAQSDHISWFLPAW